MRRLCAVALALFVAVLARADDPLRLIPAQAHLAVKVEKPRQLVESVLALDVFRQLEKLDAFQDVIGSSNSRQFYQLVGYFEKELGVSWSEMLERLAGDGIVLAVKYGSDAQPALAVMQARDAALLRKFVELGLRVIEQELARQDIKYRPVKGNHRGIETIQLGNNFHAAVADAALLISNKEEVLHYALDMHLDKDKPSVLTLASLKEARQPEALAWLWLDMEAVRQLPGAKQAFEVLGTDINGTLLFGSWIDLLKRAAHVSATLTGDAGGFTTSIRVPAGREGSGPPLLPYLPPVGQTPALPVLQPKGVLLSTSYYWDLGTYWTQRDKLFNEAQRKSFEQADKQSAPFLAGNTLSNMLTQVGPYQRFVIAHQNKLPYAKQPTTRLPAFALVLSMKDGQFGRSMETLFRAGALLSTTQVGLKMSDEMIGDVKLVSYRFPENANLNGDPNGVRFNFVPCFATVGDQFLMASSQDLGRDLIGLLQQEAKNPAAKGEAGERTVFYSAGVADLLKAIEDQILAQTMLDRAASPAEAKKQVEIFLDLVRRLGTFELGSKYGERSFQYDIRFKAGK